jgi:hypothetical protein
MIHTDNYFAEIRLSRAFAVEFEKFAIDNPKLIPSNLMEAYSKLKKEYEFQINRNLS